MMLIELTRRGTYWFPHIPCVMIGCNPSSAGFLARGCELFGQSKHRILRELRSAEGI